MNTPRVSVIMAAYKGQHLVRETWDSLAAQTFTDFELIVVDDRSPDDTLGVLRAIDDRRVTVIAADANGGPVRARNLAFAHARGAYVAGLDQDDLCRPERLARQVAHLDANAGTVLVAATAARLVAGAILPSRGPAETTPALIDWMMGVCNPLAWSSVMFRRDAVRDDPFTRPDRLYAEDFDLYHRLRGRGTIARIDTPLIDYRVHAGGASQTYRDTMIANTAAVLADAHRALFGDEADARALLLATHVAAALPVPDAAAFARLADTLARVHARFMTTHALDATDAALVAAEHARLWWGIARAAVRSGAVPLARVAALRPAGVPFDARSADLLVSGVIGRGRALVAGLRA